MYKIRALSMFLDSETGLKHTQTRDVKTIVEFYIFCHIAILVCFKCRVSVLFEKWPVLWWQMLQILCGLCRRLLSESYRRFQCAFDTEGTGILNSLMGFGQIWGSVTSCVYYFCCWSCSPGPASDCVSEEFLLVQAVIRTIMLHLNVH